MAYEVKADNDDTLKVVESEVIANNTFFVW